MRSTTPTLVWFRQDLRLADNPALTAAVKKGGPVIPVFIWAPEEEGEWPPGRASKWWLHQSLQILRLSLEELGSRMIFRQYNSEKTLRELAHETGAQTVFWNRRYEPAIRKRDEDIKAKLRAEGIEAQSFNSALLHEPWTIKNQSGKPFQVFTPFWRHCLNLPQPAEPIPNPALLTSPRSWPASMELSDLKLEPKIDWAGGLNMSWTPSSTGAAKQLRTFLKAAHSDYPIGRNTPGISGTSRLSPHLHFGEISPCQVWHALKRKAERSHPGKRDWLQNQFVTELGWREFSHHLLYHFPETDRHPLRKDFEKFHWRKHPEWLKAWEKGQTGYPLVDAGMRELWSTGWMHNRVRMVVASFLVKDLLISWQSGAQWFWDTLVDADLAQNSMGWQWTAGCGADAAPFFRIFNPVTQGEKFDPEGLYVRRWVPEIARLPDKWIHQPFAAPQEILAAAGVTLDENYPQPIVRHSIAREVALEAYAKLKS